MDRSLSKFWELVMDREAWHAAVHGVAKSRTRLSNWTELNYVPCWKFPPEFPHLWNDILIISSWGWIQSKADIHICVQVFVCVDIFRSVGHIFRSLTLECTRGQRLGFSETAQVCFKVRFASPPRQWMKFPISPHSHQQIWPIFEEVGMAGIALCWIWTAWEKPGDMA